MKDVTEFLCLRHLLLAAHCKNREGVTPSKVYNDPEVMKSFTEPVRFDYDTTFQIHMPDKKTAFTMN